MDMEGNKPIIIILILLVGFAAAVAGSIALTNTPPEPIVYAPTASPTTTPTTTPIPEAPPQVENASNVNHEGQTDYNDTSFLTLQEQANKGLSGQTPNNYSRNLTGNNYVDYTRLAEMYPWIKGYNDSSEYPWMWTPEKWRYMMNGQGETERIILYNQWTEKQQVKTPQITLEILHTDGTPYDFNRETFVIGNTYEGNFSFKNVGDTPFQGNVAVVVNASLFFAGSMVHMENLIIPDQFLSLYPGQTNEFYRRWTIDKYNNAPIPTGAFNIQIDIRDLSSGQTIYTVTVKPIVARDPNHDGILTF